MTPLLLATQYLVRQKARCLLLILSFAALFLLPLASRSLLQEFERLWMARAESTPLVLGARGSRFDLALFATWFQGQPPGPITMADWEEVRQSGYADAFLLNIETKAQGFPLVGSSTSYLRWRGLEPSEGRHFSQLGEVVLGAAAARQLQLRPGDTLLTDPTHSFSLAAAYPLELSVAGVLRESGSPDDHAIFTDVKTAWVAQGLGHGHDDVKTDTEDSVILERREGEIIANARLLEFQRITPENIASFHFHGDPAEFPLSALIVVPHDARGEALLLGRYLAPGKQAQLIRPSEALGNVLTTILQVQRMLDLASLIIGFLALCFTALIVALSLKVRQDEMATLRLLGAPRWLIAATQIIEYAIPLVLGLSLSLAAASLAATQAPALAEFLYSWRYAK